METQRVDSAIRNGGRMMDVINSAICPDCDGLVEMRKVGEHWTWVHATPPCTKFPSDDAYADEDEILRMMEE